MLYNMHHICSSIMFTFLTNITMELNVVYAAGPLASWVTWGGSRNILGAVKRGAYTKGKDTKTKILD
mgnify:CR=1 FL=1